MLEFVTQKMLNKKWMIICLIIGNILLVAVSACNPMYTDAIQKKSLSTAMTNYIIENNSYPGLVTINAQINSMGSNNNSDSFFEAKDKAEEIKKNMGLKVAESVTTYYLPKLDCETESTYDGKKARKKLTIGMIEDLREHIKMVSGEMYSDEIKDDTIEAVISQKGLVTQKLLIGETLVFNDIEMSDGNPLKVKITGVFENSKDEDLYWVNEPSSFTSEILISEKAFMDKFGDFENTEYKTRGVWYLLFDYEQIRGSNCKEILNKTKSYMNFFSGKESYNMQVAYFDILNEQIQTSKVVASTLRVLQVPVLVLLAAFIFMVSRQILEIEQNDISILKSRGASKQQIILSYLLQSLIVAGIGIVIGLPVAALLCQIFGSANAFLEFVQRRALSLRITWTTLLYMLVAVIISIVAMVVPVFKIADMTIVETKQKKIKRKNTVWWQRYFLDVLMLAVSLYGFYTFNSNKADLVKKAAAGANMDPLLFLSSSLFIVGAGLVALRIIPLITGLIFKINKNKWKPESYASFLQVIRSKNKQYFIMIFLILTIALGIFNARTARTINTNEENQISYANGADIVLMEKWDDNDKSQNDDTTDNSASDEVEADLDSQDKDTQKSDESDSSKSDDENDKSEAAGAVNADDYTEPDIEKYKTIEGVKNIAKVYVTNEASISVQTSDEKVESQKVTLMGINTKDFGQTAWFEDSTLLPTHWYNYLNAISQNTSAVLVSTNFRDKLGYKLGDVVMFMTETKQSVRGVIYGFVDYWPGYEKKVTETNSDGSENEMDNFLIVSHLSRLQSIDGVLPYQVWIKMEKSTQPVYDFIADKNIKLNMFKDTKEQIIEMKNDPVIQGTNGILTVGFVVVLVLCGAGFMIYWVLSIKARALQFGIFRAMGMTMREILNMLIFEQIFITLPTIITGTVIGFIASKLYIPLIQIAYSATNESIPLRVMTAGGDIVKMYFVVVFVIGICMAVLGNIIKKIKITQAIKLGED